MKPAWWNRAGTLIPVSDWVRPGRESVVAGSFEDIRQCVQDAISDRCEALTGLPVSVWVCDIGATWAVYYMDMGGQMGSDTWMIDYSIDDANVVTLGSPIEVTKVTSYVADVPPVTTSGEVLMEAVESVPLPTASTLAIAGVVSG